ncbi:sensor domain-containing diguanylate cyclase [Sphingomonas sp. PB2P19]|uniref:GGDEF domain-containing protein n=1 Tax=Sphingomonas rhamnosi TaxID=3096156 RepID=UPI002FC6AE94
MPLAGPRDSSNLFAALEQHAPEVRSIVADFAPATGRVCDGHRIFVDLGSGRGAKGPTVIACTIVKLGPDRLMATLTDISQQVVQEQRLRQADTWFATLLDGINDYAALEITPEGDIVSADPGFTHQTGYDSIAAIGCNLGVVLGHEAQGGNLRLDEQLVVAKRDGWHLQEGWQLRANGERYWCQRLVVARSDNDGSNFAGFSVVLRDVPRREAATEDLRRLLTRDHLTGAANRRHFRQTLERELTHWRELRQPLSLIMLDLDHFKTVNDMHGHPVGDLLLQRITTACTEMLPPRCLFARLGGEEFGALLPRFDLAQAIDLAEDLREAIATLEIQAPSGPLSATASFGCATLDEAEGSIDVLIALADQRLYNAKHDGRNQVFHPSTDAA